MVTQSSDLFQSLLAELVPDASGATTPEGDGMMPMGGGEAGSPAGGELGTAASEPTPQRVLDYLSQSLSPDDQTAFTQELEAEFEARFKEDKRKLQQSYDNRLNQVQGQNEQLQRNLRELSNWRSAMMSAVQRYNERLTKGETTPDPRDVAQLLLEAGATAQQQTQSYEGWRQEFASHAKRDLDAHNAEVNRRAFIGEGEARQQIFDPNHPEILQAFGNYASALRRTYESVDPRTGEPDPRHLMEGQRLFAAYQRTIDKVEKDAQFGMLSGRIRGTNGQIAERRQIQAERGAQDRGRGGAAGPMTWPQYMDAAKAELGDRASAESIFDLALKKQMQAENSVFMTR